MDLESTYSLLFGPSYIVNFSFFSIWDKHLILYTLALFSVIYDLVFFGRSDLMQMVYWIFYGCLLPEGDPLML